MRAWILVAVGLTACGETKPATYHADVRPVVEAKCVSCHQDGGVGPFSMTHDLDSWVDGAPPWAESAVASVAAGSMPPWSPEDDCRPIQHSRALTDDEKSVFARWADHGFTAGSPAAYVAPALPELWHWTIVFKPLIRLRRNMT